MTKVIWSGLTHIRGRASEDSRVYRAVLNESGSGQHGKITFEVCDGEDAMSQPRWVLVDFSLVPEDFIQGAAAMMLKEAK